MCMYRVPPPLGYYFCKLYINFRRKSDISENLTFLKIGGAVAHPTNPRTIIFWTLTLHCIALFYGYPITNVALLHISMEAHV